MKNLIVFMAVLALTLLGSAGIANAGDNVFSLPSGNVGIGTTSPAYKLTVEVDGNQAVDAFAVKNSATGNPYLSVSTGHASFGYTSKDIGVFNNYVLALGSRGTTYADQYSLAAVGGVLLATNEGRVGIGTTSPAATLEVGKIASGAAGNKGAIQITGNSPFLQFRYNGPVDNSNVAIMLDEGALKIRKHNDNGSSQGDIMVIERASGNVGIGITPTVGYKLDVNGVILANDVDIVGSTVSVSDLISKVAVLEATPPEAALLARLEALEAIVLDLPPGLLNQKDRNADTK